MPIYNFECKHCNEKFESLTTPYEPVVCPKCKTYEVDKRPSVIGTYTIKGNNSASTRPRKR